MAYILHNTFIWRDLKRRDLQVELSFIESPSQWLQGYLG